MRQAEQTMLDDHPLVPVDFSTHRVLVSKRVKGYADAINNTHRSRYMRIDGSEAKAAQR